MTMAMIIAGMWGMADIFVFLMNEKRRALHDIIAGTVVVKITGEENAAVVHHQN
jgi:uncharacterized RDD family membrane protein YckC